MYKLFKDKYQECVLRIADDGAVSFIPMIEDNADYKDYLAWLDGYTRTPEGLKQVSGPNTPEPADQVQVP